MTYSWDAILTHLAERLSEITETKIEPQDIVLPPKPDLGDVAFGCFKLAKAKGKSPADIAKELAESFTNGDHIVESCVAAGPYLNFTFSTGEFIKRIVSDVERYQSEFGSSTIGGGKELMLEYAQPNTHKEIHVGHLRNLVLGSSVAKILQRAGWKVVTASYHGDVGAHVAKCLWLLVHRTSPDALRSLDVETADSIIEAIPRGERTGAYLGKLYSESTRELEDHPEYKEEISFVQQQLESYSAGWDKLWRETRRWSLAEIGELFQEFSVKIDRQYLESEVVEAGQQIVDELLAKNIAKHSEGAIAVDLEDQKLGFFLIRKSDGTSLYATKDLALAKLKAEEYPHMERSLLMVDNRQSLYFQQLFATLKLMGMTQQMEFTGYEFVTLKSGAMSRREGNIVTLESFRDEVVSLAMRETTARHADWFQGKVSHTAWCLAMSGIKFGMLKQDSDKIFTFDLEQALSFDGDTGPYVQYAATRLQAILRKGEWNSEQVSGDLLLLSEPLEKRLAVQLAQFPDACRRAAEELRPALIAQWCLTLAHRVTEFYHGVKVLDAEPELRMARLRLIASIVSTVTIALDILGIPTPEEM